MRLPRSLEEIQGRRAARWIRESTRGQYDSFGPDAQRDQQDRAIARYGLVDTGVAWTVAHSGRTISSTEQFRAMVASAGRDFDVLVVGYVSRFARDLRTAVNARHDLHAAGAAILFADERVLSSDEEQWEQFAREAVEAEAYSRRLGRRIREGYEAKFRRHADPGGNAPLGFIRVNGLLTIDQATIGRAVGVFERYATGTLSLVELGFETGLDPDALRMIVRNPIYNGWVVRHRRSPVEQRRPAAWRDDPPVPDELWQRVQDVRHRRHTGGGHPTPRHAYLLNGVLFCECGTRIRAEMNAGRRRYRHPGEPCPAWSKSTVAAERFDAPISEQVRRTKPSARWMTELRALTTVNAPRPDVLRRRRLERELADRALAHAAQKLSTAGYLAEHDRLTAQIKQLAEQPTPALVDPDVAIRWLADMSRAWEYADLEARHKVVAALYDRIVVRSDGFVEVELSAAANAHVVAAAMPEKVVLARPAGVGPQRTIEVRIPIVARREWLRLLSKAG